MFLKSSKGKVSKLVPSNLALKNSAILSGVSKSLKLTNLIDFPTPSTINSVSL